jgi:putative nucleotidyltransferase with HDIG domain
MELFNEYPFKMLQMLKKTEQSVKYHPEGNVWNHTLLVLDEAAKVRDQSKDPKALMWAALLHDIGKPGNTRMRKGKITSYDHDKEGAKLCVDFLHAMTEDEDFIQKVADLVRYHMHMLYVLKKLPYSDVENMLQKVDIHEIALLCRCDRLGRTGADIELEDAEYREFLKNLKQMIALKKG